VGDGRSLDGRIKQEGASLYLLTDEKSNYGKHTNTSMSQLRLTVALDSSLISFGCNVFGGRQG